MILRFPVLGKAKNKKISLFPFREEPNFKKVDFPVLGKTKNKKSSFSCFGKDKKRAWKWVNISHNKNPKSQARIALDNLLKFLLFEKIIFLADRNKRSDRAFADNACR